MADVASFVYYGAGSAVTPNTLQLSSAVPINMHTTGASIVLTNTNVSISGATISAAPAAGQQVVIGSGSAQTGFKLTAQEPSYLGAATTLRQHVLNGVNRKLDTTYATTATGICPINPNLSSAFDVNCTGDMAFVILADDGDWYPNSMRTVELLIHMAAGGKNIVFPTSVKWGSQRAPDYSFTKAGDFDIVRLHTKDGVTWFGESVYASTDYSRLPAINFFSAQYGTTSKITWNVSDAGSISITGLGPVSATGSHTFTTPSAPAVYTLTAVGNDGRVTTAAITINPAA